MKKYIIFISLIIASVAILLGFNSKSFTQKQSFLSFLSNNTLEEKSLSEVTNTMYVTMLDKKAKVIATTNPETQIDSNYSFTETQKPRIQPNTTDEYFILLDIVDTNGSNGYTKVEENVIYTMELPEYITPTDAYDEGIEPTEKCTQFSKKGQTVACGGIYKNEDKYIFKVIFSNTLNKRNVKASYQFTINLNKKIEDNIFTLKTIDFNLPGAIQLFMEKEEIPIPPIPEEKDYDINLSGEWTSSTKNYAKWTVTITDNHTDGYKMNGSLYIDFGPYMAFPLDQNHWYDKIKMYADGEELANWRQGLYTTLFKKSSQESYNGLAIVSMLNKEDPLTEYEYMSNYSFSASQLKIDLSEIIENEIQNTNIEGVHEWKIEFITKEYSDKPTTFNAQVRFIDKNDIEKEYKDQETISNTMSSSFNFNYEQKNVNNYNIAETLSFNVKIDNNSSNLLKLKSVPEDYNGLGLYYFMDAIGFTYMNNNLSDSIKIKINNKEIKFTRNGWSASSMVSGQTTKADPLLQKLLEKTDTYDYCFSSGYIDYDKCVYFKSEETNEDGDYYWIVLSEDTAKKIEDLFPTLDYIDKNTSYMPQPANWEFTLLNAKGSDIELNWDQNLQFYDRISERISTYSSNSNRPISQYGSYLGSNFYVNDSYKQTSYSPIYLYTPLRIKGEVLNDNIIKWEMKIDTQYMHTLLEQDSSNSNLSSLKFLLLNFKIPSSHFIYSGYYDVDTNSIVKQTTSNSINTEKVSTCIKGNINTYDTSNYDLFECTKYEEGNSLFRSKISYPTASYYPDLKELDHINKISNQNSSGTYANYTSYYSSIIPKSINALQGDQKGEIRLVFFTKSYDIGEQEDTIYVDAIGTTNRKAYGRTNYSTYAPIPAFSITNKASLPKSEVTKHIDRTSNNNSNITKHWRLMVNFTANSFPMSSVFEEKKLSHNTSPDVYNGTYQFTDKFNTTTDNERIIAENTKLTEIYIGNTNNYTKYYDSYNNAHGTSSLYTDLTIYKLNEQTKDENGYVKVCNSSVKQFCIKIRYNYGDDCPTYNKDDENCTKYENMKYGFEVITEGFNKSFYPVFTYTTETDIEKVAKEIDKDSFENSSIEVENIAQEYNFENNPYTTNSYKQKTTYELLADLYIKKKVVITEDTNYRNDTKTHELKTTIGNSPTDYLDITDFIDGIGSIEIDATQKPENPNTNYDDLKEIRKYLHIRNLQIDIKEHYDSDSLYNTIFSNGSFTDEYNGSTFEFIEGTNELYKLHLVKSNGEKIPAMQDVRIKYTMNLYLDEELNYRLKDLYEGKKLYISTNAEAIRSYESNPQVVGTSSTKKAKVKPLSSTNGQYENKIDSTNHTLTAYASNNGVEVGADYLYPGEILKTLNTDSNSNLDHWKIQYIINSAGKDEKVSMDIVDHFNFEVEGESRYNNQIIEILNRNALYKNIKIYYDGKNTSLDKDPVYEWNNPLENKNISFGNITGNLVSTNDSYELHLAYFNYGDVVLVTYDFDVDYESAYREMLEKGIINEEMKLTDTNELLSIHYNNRLIDNRYPESFVEKSSSNISISDYIPIIHKKNKGRSNDETSWEINFNTGLTSSKITVKDNVLIKADDGSLKSIIEEATILKDLEIKIGDEVVYTNGEFKDNWNENITIQQDNLSYKFTIKDTPTNTFINQNKKVVITYKSALDYNKYKGKDNSGTFSIENKAEIEKDGLTSEDVLESNGISFDFPINAKKQFLGNNEDLTETNWKISLETGKMDRENLHIKDIATLGGDFGKYLSISKLKITKGSEVIYDSENNINNLEGIELKDIDGNALQLNQNGIYQFDLEASKLEKMTTIDIEYTLKVDKEAYILNKEILDNELLIQNNLEVTANDGTNINKESKGSSKVTSKLLKKFEFLGYDNQGNPKMRWFIDINLLSDYSIDELNGKQVIVTDSLSDVLGLIDGTVELKKMNITSNSSSVGEKIDQSKYELNTENNTLTINILDPTETNQFEISFETIAYASLSQIDNSATLQIGDEITSVDVSNRVQVFSPYSFGRVSSNDVLTHHFKAKKYFDGNLSNKQFIFEIQEVNEAGEVKENGFYARNTNAEDGTVTFNGITYFSEGTYYYKIKEIPENNENIVYDTTEYIAKVEVAQKNDDFIIEKISLENTESEEIVFNNKTKEDKNIINTIINPNTGRVFIALLIISIVILITKKAKRKYTN